MLRSSLRNRSHEWHLRLLRSQVSTLIKVNHPPLKWRYYSTWKAEKYITRQMLSKWAGVPVGEISSKPSIEKNPAVEVVEYPHESATEGWAAVAWRMQTKMALLFTTGEQESMRSQCASAQTGTPRTNLPSQDKRNGIWSSSAATTLTIPRPGAIAISTLTACKKSNFCQITAPEMIVSRKFTAAPTHHYYLHRMHMAILTYFLNPKIHFSPLTCYRRLRSKRQNRRFEYRKSE